MTPEIHAHFHVEASNCCNFCCPHEPKGYYVSKHGVIKPWEGGKPEDATASYLRLRKLVIQRFIDLGIDVNKGIELLDNTIDLPAKAETQLPVSTSDLHKTAETIESLMHRLSVHIQK